MVSIEKSMKKAIYVMMYSIVWWIIGIVLICIGFSLIGINEHLYTSAQKSSLFDISVLCGLILVFVGVVIIICGFLASFMKINTELILEELNTSGIKDISDSTKAPFYEDPEPNHSQVNKITYVLVAILICIVTIFILLFNSIRQ